MSIQLGATASVKEKSNETEKKMLEERDRAASTKFLVFLYLSKLVNVVKETFWLLYCFIVFKNWSPPKNPQVVILEQRQQ